MALTKAQYIDQGRYDAGGHQLNGNLYGSESWQGKAYTEGHKQGVAARNERKGVQSIAPAATPAQQRRAERIECIARGYIAALQWSAGDDENESFEDINLSSEAQAEALAIATAFYDANSTDLGAYADLREGHVGTDIRNRHQEAYSFAGHDLWLTSQGHGVGFWDRGLGRLGDRLTKAAKAFEGVYAYVSDAGFVELSIPYHAAWKKV